MYTLDKQQAIDGSTGSFSNRIDKEGAYTGKLLYLRHLQSTSSNSRGVRMHFVSDSGQEASMLDIWTHGREGNELFGLKSVQALMAVCKKRTINFVSGQVTEYSFSSGRDEPLVADVDLAFSNIRIGLVLNVEQYSNQKGEDREKIIFVAPFDAETKQVASEILEQKPAERLESIIQKLKPKNSRKKKDNTHQASYDMQAPGSPPLDAYNDEDDIPF